MNIYQQKNNIDRIPEIREFAQRLSDLKSRINDSPIDFIRLLPPQEQVARNTSRFRLFRAGSQGIGKTHLGLCEVIWRCRGKHPYQKVPKKAIEAWIMCASWSQCRSVQKKLYNLLPKNELKEGTVFNGVKGFRGKFPAVEFKNGSTIIFKTTSQSPEDLASASIDFVLFDEPPKSPEVYDEVTTRVRSTNGSVLLCLTPLNTDCSWLKKLCDDGKIVDLHFQTKAEYFIPVGRTKPILCEDGITPKDQAWIDAYERETSPHIMPVRVHGEWEQRILGSRFELSWKPDIHVINEVVVSDDDKWIIGIDHGSGEKFSEYACLLSVTPDETVRVVDEYVSDGQTTDDQDALAIVEMLARHGLKWTPKQIWKAFGDRPWNPSKYLRKSNQIISEEIEKVYNKKKGTLLPELVTVKRGKGHLQGSVALGTKYIHNSLIKNKLFIGANCERLIECMNRWNGSDNEYKHSIDALRYACSPFIFKEDNRVYDITRYR